jgi:hypothetical protein
MHHDWWNLVPFITTEQEPSQSTPMLGAPAAGRNQWKLYFALQQKCNDTY